MQESFSMFSLRMSTWRGGPERDIFKGRNTGRFFSKIGEPSLDVFLIKSDLDLQIIPVAKIILPPTDNGVINGGIEHKDFNHKESEGHQIKKRRAICEGGLENFNKKIKPEKEGKSPKRNSVNYASFWQRRSNR